ncbi:hypothetical protein RGQ29_005857 [Quercus rubra]|uniref:SCP domain-containing protein n=1 Tax=Quercus rubra TaxID=3512 RepID=A0AAN7I806_QUERU|nr:hypothetical protein RGQ29_005857 [Quercus rubra]
MGCFSLSECLGSSSSKSSPPSYIVWVPRRFTAQLHTSHAQNSQQDYLNDHNVARAQVGVPNITWDSTVATCAQNYANSRIGDCNLVHSNGSYGENLAKGSGSFTGTAAVNLWVAEKNCYDYNSHTCVGGQCLHYTQVV